MRTANTQIKTLTQRQRLQARSAPYYNSIAPRRLLGYIRHAGERTSGCWVVQVEIGRTETGKPVRRREQLGIADDVAEANGTDVLSYQQALAAAIEWRPNEAASGSGGNRFTVRDAVEQHRDFGGKHGDKTERAKAAAYNSLRWNVLREKSDGKPREGAPGLGDVAVADLTTDMLKAWRDGLINHDAKATDERSYTASRASAERAWSDFRSCLEQAYLKKENGIPSADAWRNVVTLGKKGNARMIHFEMNEALRIIETARANSDTAVADLFEAYMLTGSRPGGELACLRVCDFNPRLQVLNIPDRSETVISKTGKRQIALTDEATAFFLRITAGRPASAPLLPSSEGGHWDRRSRYFKDVLMRAGAPADATPYSFRHSHISRWVETGESLKVIADNCGTSVAMIEQVYAKSLPSKVREMVQKTAPKLRLVRNDEPVAA